MTTTRESTLDDDTHHIPTVDATNEQLLYDMGFTNRSLNRTVLQENDNNLDRTVEILIQRQ